MTGAALDTSALSEAIARKRKLEPPERRTQCKVRRGSWLAGSNGRARLTWYDCNQRIRALHKWERKQKKRERRKNRAVGHIGVAVYEYLARRATHPRQRLDDLAYEALAAIVGYSRSAVVEAVKRLKQYGWLDWRRQYRPTGQPGVRGGVQVEQAPNAFVILAPVEQLLAIGIRLGRPPPPDDHAAAAEAGRAANAAADLAESPLGRALERLGAQVCHRETS